MYRYNLPEKFRVLDGSALKIIACITMLIDHAAVCLIFNSILMPNAPIIQGTDLYNLYTFYKAKYALRLLVFGIISEIPFDLCIYNEMWHPSYNNVYFTLFIGLLVIWAWDHFKDRWYIQLPVGGVLLYAAHFFHTDYGWKGVLLIFILYLMHAWRVPQVVFGLCAMYWELPGVILAFIPILFYSGKRGRQLKYFYYIFYPGHLALLYLLSVYLINRI